MKHIWNQGMQFKQNNAKNQFIFKFMKNCKWFLLCTFKNSFLTLKCFYSGFIFRMSPSSKTSLCFINKVARTWRNFFFLFQHLSAGFFFYANTIVIAISIFISNEIHSFCTCLLTSLVYYEFFFIEFGCLLNFCCLKCVRKRKTYYKVNFSTIVDSCFAPLRKMMMMILLADVKVNFYGHERF